MKKRLGIILAACMMLAFTLPAGAAEPNTTVMSIDVGSPRYDNLSTLAASLTIENGTAYCDSSFYQRNTKRAVMTTQLQRRQRASDSWSTVATWSDEFSSTGSHLVEHTRTVSSGYEYRNHMTVKFYSGSTVVENVSIDSPVKVS